MFDQLHHAIHSSSICLEHFSASIAHLRARQWIGEQSRDFGRQLGRVLYDDHRPTRDQTFRNIRRIEVVGPGQDRSAERCGLEEIMSSNGDQATSDERDIACRVKHHQLTERVDDQHRVVVCDQFISCATSESNPSRCQ